MNKLKLLLIGLLVATNAHAQFSPGTVLTATALNAALAAPAITSGSINGNTTIITTGPVTLTGVTSLGAQASATTPGYLDSTTHVATTQYVGRSLLAATASIPFTVTSGTYNFATAGSGAIFGVTTSGGAVASITSIVAGGTGYQVGDVLVLVGGNGDGAAYVSSVSSGVVTAATILYGGTGYSGTPQLTGMGLPPGSRTGVLSGTLTGNVTIVVPAGTYLAGARRFSFANNTTGAFTVTVKLSNGTGGSTGTGVVLPQGTNNSTSLTLYTNGVSDVWAENGAVPNFIIANSLTVAGLPVLPNLSGTSGSLGGTGLAQGACSTTSVTIAGATTTMTVSASPQTFPGSGFFWRGYVSAANTVTVLICSAQGGTNTPTASLYNVRVEQ